MFIDNISNKFDTSDKPLQKFKNFIAEQNDIKLKLENVNEKPSDKIQYEKKYRYIGKFINISYKDATLITNDDVIFYNGGIPKSSFLIATLSKFEYDKMPVPEHFMLLKVTETAPTPATQEMTKTYLEWNKKANPELDDFTKSDLKWSALKCEIVGQFYKKNKSDNFDYASDLNFHMSPLNYNIYKPSKDILDIILNNEFLSEKNTLIPIKLGTYRPIENLLNIHNTSEIHPDVYIDGTDILGSRTAMFGKTRLGKSNTVKLLIKNMTKKIKDTKYSVGQLIFDVNGEYAYSNEQDSDDTNKANCIKDIFPNDCIVYSLNNKEGKEKNKELKINFYKNPSQSITILKDFINSKYGVQSKYIEAFLNVPLYDSLNSLNNLRDNHEKKSEYTRNKRKILMYWAILYKAGYNFNKDLIKEINGIHPKFAEDSRSIAYGDSKPIDISTMEDLISELEVFARKLKTDPSITFRKGENKDPLFDTEDKSLLEFLIADNGNRSGLYIIKNFKNYHSSNVDDFTAEILNELDSGKIVILDLASATDEVRKYFSNMLSKGIFNHQENKFISNKLDNHYIQIYFEEAHNIFPKDNDPTNIYARFAKEGAKFNIGIIYSTQSPSTINNELLNQTENFFIGHISSPAEVKALSNLNIEFVGVENDILKNKQKGYMRVLTNSHRFVIPIQINLFNE